MFFNRRKFLSTAAGAAFLSTLPFAKAFAKPQDEGKGFIVAEKDDEVFIHGNGLSKATLCLDKTTRGVNDVSLCKWDMQPGGTVPLHRHLVETEIIFIEDGSCRFALGEKEFEVHKGDAIYIPKGEWHGFATDGSQTVKMIMSYAPSGFEGFFRETGRPPGAKDWKPKTGPEMGELAKKYNVEVKR